MFENGAHDIANLIGTEEGPRTEFKRTLATSDGRPDRWMMDQSRIGNVARDDIAKEVVAFANAYGGILIVGIEETDDNPKRAKSITSQQIPRVVDCAEQLDRALRSIIEPPLPMLEMRGIVSEGDRGVLLVRVGSSPSAPHGFGRPSAAYVRRGSNSEPLTMRDLQSMFFERRTRLERVQIRRDALRSEGEQLRATWIGGELRKPYDNQVFVSNYGLFFRCSAAPSEDFAIDNFPDEFLKIPDHSAPKPIILEHGALIELPSLMQQWRRRYRSVEHIANAGDQRFWKATIEADGSINQISIRQFTTQGGSIYLNAYAAALLQVMVLSEWLRRWSSRREVEYVLDADFVCHGPVHFHFHEAQFDSTSIIPWSLARVGPYSIGRRDGFPSTFDSIERELWDPCGMRRQSHLQLKANFDAVFESMGL
jgi:hypothetical protein